MRAPSRRRQPPLPWPATLPRHSPLPPSIHPAVYTAFYLQQAAVLFRPNGTRSLHVGLGIGTAVKGMQRLGWAAGGWVASHTGPVPTQQRPPSAKGGKCCIAL